MGRAVICWRCQLDDLLSALLAGPDGQIPKHMRPLVTALLDMPRPLSGYAWIRRNTQIQELLRALASKDLDLDHGALDALPPSRSLEYLRGLLIAHRCLPPRDPHLARFERWLADKLTEVDDPEHRKIVERFGRWRLLHRLRRQGNAGQVSASAFLNAKQSMTVGIQFIAWLAARDRDLSSASQQDIDAWFAGGPSTRKHARRFISWASEQRMLPQLELPAPTARAGDVMGTRERLEHLRRVLLHDDLPVAHRVVAVLVLLHGQPLTKIVRLRRDAVTVDGDRVELGLGHDALLLPPPAATLMKAFLEDPRFRHNTAANPDSPWLFPGTNPGQPLHIFTAQGMLKAAGIPARAARAGAWLDLVRQAPPAVLADMLGIGANTAMRYAALAGADYLAYTGSSPRLPTT
jgi:hypothetical protein